MHLSVLQNLSQRRVLLWIWYRKEASLSLWLWMEAPFWSPTHMTNQCNLVWFDSSSALGNYTFIASVSWFVFVLFLAQFQLKMQIRWDIWLLCMPTTIPKYTRAILDVQTVRVCWFLPFILQVYKLTVYLFSNKNMLIFKWSSLCSVKSIGRGTIFRLML